MQAHGHAETDAIKVTESNTSAMAPQLQNRAVIGFSESNRIYLCTAMRLLDPFKSGNFAATLLKNIPFSSYQSG